MAKTNQLKWQEDGATADNIFYNHTRLKDLSADELDSLRRTWINMAHEYILVYIADNLMNNPDDYIEQGIHRINRIVYGNMIFSGCPTHKRMYDHHTEWTMHMSGAIFSDLSIKHEKISALEAHKGGGKRFCYYRLSGTCHNDNSDYKINFYETAPWDTPYGEEIPFVKPSFPDWIVLAKEKLNQLENMKRQRQEKIDSARKTKLLEILQL